MYGMDLFVAAFDYCKIYRLKPSAFDKLLLILSYDFTIQSKTK